MIWTTLSLRVQGQQFGWAVYISVVMLPFFVILLYIYKVSFPFFIDLISSKDSLFLYFID